MAAPYLRPIRFLDLRHSTASLLMMSGANPASVERILRHSDPKLTTEVHGHLSPEYLFATAGGGGKDEGRNPGRQASRIPAF